MCGMLPGAFTIRFPVWLYVIKSVLPPFYTGDHSHSTVYPTLPDWMGLQALHAESLGRSLVLNFHMYIIMKIASTFSDELPGDNGHG